MPQFVGEFMARSLLPLFAVQRFWCPLSNAHLAHIAPVAFRHISMNGKMHFALDDYAWPAPQKNRKPAEAENHSTSISYRNRRTENGAFPPLSIPLL